ncbi:MAG: contractile injection system protein, VgrG/Pvc8 family [bacterium]|nr:contractile injection system protein, VgrG/Pvc8 family [bacterium]
MNPITTLARVRLELDGAAFAPENGLLTEVRVQQRLSLPTLCELTFTDAVTAAMPTGQFAPGQTLTVSVESAFTPLFTGQVTAVERTYHAANQRETRVRAYDPLHALRKRQSVRAHIELTLAGLARALVSDLALAVDAHADSPLWSFLIQHRQTDFDLLADLADRAGVYLAVRENTLHLLTLEGVGDAALPLTLGETLFEARFEVNADPALRTATAAAWNARRVEAYASTTGAARTGRDVRTSADPAAVQGTGERAFVGEHAENIEHAAALAQAELDRQIAREVVFWGVAEGDPRLRPGAQVQIDGVESGFAGAYVIAGATHTINTASSYNVQLTTLPPPRRERSYSASATLGTVTAIDGGLGRVRAILNAYQDIETDWMHVLSLGAGAGKGLIIVPDVGDEVLILLIDSDPAQGVVLGGLFGMNGSIDPGIESGGVRRFTLLTPGGQRVRLDDAGRTIRVENSEGSYIELTPDQVRLHAAADLTLEAPGKHIIMRGSTIDFQRG